MEGCLAIEHRDIIWGAASLASFWVILFSVSFISVLKEDRATLNAATEESQQLKLTTKDLQRQVDNNCKEDKQNLQQAKQEAQVERTMHDTGVKHTKALRAVIFILIDTLIQKISVD